MAIEDWPEWAGTADRGNRAFFGCIPDADVLALGPAEFLRRARGGDYRAARTQTVTIGRSNGMPEEVIRRGRGGHIHDAASCPGCRAVAIEAGLDPDSEEETG